MLRISLAPLVFKKTESFAYNKTGGDQKTSFGPPTGRPKVGIAFCHLLLVLKKSDGDRHV